MAENEVPMWLNPFTGVREPAPPRAPRGFTPPAPKEKKAKVEKAKPEPKAKEKIAKAKDKAKAQAATAKAQAATAKAKGPQDAPPAKVTPKSNGGSADNMTIEQIADEMDSLREQFAKLGTRTGAAADKMVKRYRYLTLAFKNKGPEGITPPKLWDDMAPAPAGAEAS